MRYMYFEIIKDTIFGEGDTDVQGMSYRGGSESLIGDTLGRIARDPYNFIYTLIIMF